MLLTPSPCPDLLVTGIPSEKTGGTGAGFFSSRIRWFIFSKCFIHITETPIFSLYSVFITCIPNINFGLDGISFVILYLLSNNKTYKLYVPINPFKKNNSTRIINKLINKEYQNTNVFVEFYKNAKIVKKSSIDFNEISKN